MTSSALRKLREVYIPSADELIKVFIGKYKSVEARSPLREPGLAKLIRLEMRRIRRTSSYLIELLRSIALSMPFINDLHPFYRELAGLLINLDMYKHSLAKIYNARTAVRSITRDAILMLKTSATRDDVVRTRRMYISRVIDLIQDLANELSFLREASDKLSRLPDIDPNLWTIVVSGMPNVGKSSFVRCVSTAKPRIAEYPFTTKQIHVGHIRLHGDAVIQVIDTPGLLDRPMSERNKIELQAVLALKYLPSVIVFTIDPTHHSGYELKQQIDLLREIKASFSNVPLVVLVNKIDIATDEEIEHCMRCLEDVGVEDVHKVSTLSCSNTDKVIISMINKYIVPKIIERVRRGG